MLDAESAAEGLSDQQLMIEFETLRQRVVHGLKNGTVEVCSQPVLVLNDGRQVAEPGWAWFGVHDKRVSYLDVVCHPKLSVPGFVSWNGELGCFNRLYNDGLEICLIRQPLNRQQLLLWIRGLKTLLGDLAPMVEFEGYSISINPVV